MKKGMILDIVLLVLWILVGIWVLITGPTRVGYACVWICLIFEYIYKMLRDYYEDNNNDGSGLPA